MKKFDLFTISIILICLLIGGIVTVVAATVEGIGTQTTVLADGKNFTVTPTNVENGKNVILALYEDERLVEMQSSVYKGEPLPFRATKPYKEAKVMVWDDLSSIKPVCEAEYVSDTVSLADPSSPVMYVMADVSVGATEKDDKFYIVKGYVNGEINNIRVSDNTWIEYANGDEGKYFDINLIKKSALIQFSKGSFSKNIRVIASDKDILNLVNTKKLTYGRNESGSAYLYAGVIDKYNKNNIYFEKDEGESAQNIIPFKASVCTCCLNIKSSGSEIYINRLYPGYTVVDAEMNMNSNDNDDIFLVYSYDGKNIAGLIIDTQGDMR